MADASAPPPAAASTESAAAAPAPATSAAAPAAANAAASSSDSSSLSRSIGPIRQPKASFRLSLPAWSAPPVPPFDGVYYESYETVGVIQETKRLGLEGARAHSFGRHAEWCDLVLPKISSISRQHAALVHTRSGPVLLDLFSQHGTTLNGTRLSAGQPYALHDGDVARFGGAGSFYKFKLTGRGKREPSDAVLPIASVAGSSTEADASGAASADPSAAGASTQATAASAGSSGAAGIGAGDKRKREGEASSRKDARGEGGARQSGRDRDSSSAGGGGGGGGGGLPNPKTDKVRCRHLLVKHAASRRPSSWRSERITLSLAEARAKLESLRAQLIAGNPGASELESRFTRLATVESDCSSAKMGGDLGFFAAGKMQPAFSAAAFKLRVGELSPLVETDSGVHIIWRKE